MIKHHAKIGSISHGTMRTEDLLPLFARELETLARINKVRHLHASLLHSAQRIERARDWDGAEAISTLDALCEALDDYAPMYCRFGAHEGDGSDYGFWPPDGEELENMVREDYGIVVSDLSEVPDGTQGLILLSNHHGTVLFMDTPKGRKEIWSIF